MGILSRFKDIIAANINDALDKAEDPEKMCNQYILEMTEDLAEVKKETAEVIAEEKRCRKLVEENESEADCYLCDDAEIVITAFGACSRVAKSAVNKARAEGIKAGLFRPVTLWPFPKKQLIEATKNAKAVLSVEMNMGQMVDDVKLALDCKLPVSFFGRTGGIVPSPNEVLAEIKKLNGGAQ